MSFPVARSRDEAHLYLDLHPCVCGSVETTWDSGLVNVTGGPTSRYEGNCEACGAEREYLFRLPAREVISLDFPMFGSTEPSQLLDAGEWLWVADLTAGHMPEGGEREALSIARAAVEEVIKFIPPGQDSVPDDAFWTDRGRAVHAAEPGRFGLDRLLIIRNTYRDLASH